MGEIKRLTGKRFIIVLLIAILINTSIYIFRQTGEGDAASVRRDVEEYNSLIMEYTDGQENAVITSASSDSVRLEKMIADNDVFLHQLKAGYTEGNYDVATALQNKLEHIRDYPIMLDEVQENVESLTQFSIFADEESFTYNNIIATGAAYQELESTILKLENDFAAESLTDYYIPFCIAFFIMLSLIYNIYRERENVMWDIFYASKKGRSSLIIKRIAIYTAASFVSVFAVYISTILTAYILYGGWGSLNSAIQQLNQFSKCILKTDITGYFFINMFVSWLVLYAVSVIFWILFTLIRKRNIALFIVCLLIGIEALLYTSISNHSVYVVFKYINIFSLFNIGQLIRINRNWGWGTYVFSTMQTVIFLACIIIILGLFIIIEEMKRKYPQRTAERSCRLIRQVSVLVTGIIQKQMASYGIAGAEFHKILITTKGILIICAVFLISLYFCQNIKMHFSEGMKNRDKLYLELGGEDYSGLIEYIDNVQLEHEQSENAFLAAQQKYQDGLITQDEYISAKIDMKNKENQLSFVAEFIEKEEYLIGLKQNGIDAYMISDRGYEEIFGQYGQKREMILLLLLTIGSGLLIVYNISLECDSGMEQLIKSAKAGRKDIIINKMLMCMLTVFFMFFAVYICDYIVLYKYYGMPYIQAPVVSLLFMKDCGLNMRIGTYMVMKLLSKLAFLISVAGLAFFMAIIMGKSRKKVMVLAMIILSVVTTIIYMQMSDISQFITSVICLIIGMFFLVLAGIVWCRGRKS